MPVSESLEHYRRAIAAARPEPRAGCSNCGAVRDSFPPATIVIASRNEGEWLTRTVRSIRENEPADLEIIHVDDASNRLEPDLSAWDVETIRLPRRVGAARARAIGMLRARPASRAIGTVDSHTLFGPGDTLAALAEEIERFKSLGALGEDYQPGPWEAQVCLAPAKLSTLCEIAVAFDAIAYMGPCRQGAATIRWQGPLLRVGWLGRIARPSVFETAAPFGGNYIYSRSAFERTGGYPQLPGFFGYEEETIALLAAAHRIPILCAAEMSPWHLFRSQGVDPIPCPYSTPEDRQWENLAAVYRMVSSRDWWEQRWRPALAETTLKGRSGPVPERILRSVETPAFQRYCDAVQTDFALRDEAIIEELERRMREDAARLAEHRRRGGAA